MEQQIEEPQKARIGTCWLDGCSGCHMSLLDMDEAIVDVLAKADIVFGPLVDAQEWPEGVDVAVISGLPVLRHLFRMGEEIANDEPEQFEVLGKALDTAFEKLTNGSADHAG